MAKDNKDTFGRGLMTYIADKLPYSSPYKVVDNINDINPKFKDFYEVSTRRDDLISRQSVATNQQGHDEMSPMASMSIDKNYHAFMYANVDYDKAKRLRDYRVMGQFAEVADALDEVCDECVNVDENGNIVHMRYEGEEDDVNITKDLAKEFEKFIHHYDLENKGWDYFRQLLVDGEVFFEHIIHKKHTDAGVLGVLQIPSELMDPIYDNIQNLMIKGFLLRKPVTDNSKTSNPAPANDKTKIEHIPFDRAQVTYVHSGLWNETKTLRLPFIENARRAYRQLSLIEDAIIIYRLVRAPERLVFNVDVGNMPPPKAEQYLRKLMQNYWSKKNYDSNTGKATQLFNPQSMLDNFWFAKRAGSEGTDVRSLAGGANLGQLEDLLYFKQKLYRALKVPVERLNPEAQTDAQGATILREELKFARFIIRLQQHFGAGIKAAFVTHLKLKGLWESYDVKEHHINLSFNPPSNFHELRTQQIYDLKWNNYNNAIQNPLISDTYAKKHMLKMNDDEISTNRELLRKDSAFQWEIAQIQSMGPNWRDAMEEAAEGAGAGELAGLGGGGGGMPMGGGGGLPGEFGPTPPGPEGGAPVEGPVPAEGGGPPTALP